MVTITSSAVTVSIFGFAVSIGRFFNKKTPVFQSVLVFMVPGVNHAHSKLRIREWTIIG